MRRNAVPVVGSGASSRRQVAHASNALPVRSKCASLLGYPRHPSAVSFAVRLILTTWCDRPTALCWRAGTGGFSRRGPGMAFSLEQRLTAPIDVRTVINTDHAHGPGLGLDLIDHAIGAPPR